MPLSVQTSVPCKKFCTKLDHQETPTTWKNLQLSDSTGLVESRLDKRIINKWKVIVGSLRKKNQLLLFVGHQGPKILNSMKQTEEISNFFAIYTHPEKKKKKKTNKFNSFQWKGSGQEERSFVLVGDLIFLNFYFEKVKI